MTTIYEYVKDFYNKGYYTKDDVKIFVITGDITPEEYESITGIPYKV